MLIHPMKKNRLLICSIIALALLAFSACSGKDSEFSGAQKKAQSKNQKMLLVFTGNKWSQESRDFTTSVLNDKEFNKIFDKDYVVLTIDFDSDFDKAAADTKKSVNENVLLGENYSLSQIPEVYVLSPQGYVMAVLNLTDKIKSPLALQEEIFNHAEEITHAEYLLSEINSKSGKEKVHAIDALYEATDARYRVPLSDLVKSVPELDPENETGLLGKYELEKAYLDAITAAHNNDFKGISDIFEEVCQNGHLNSQQIQTAYYTEAFVLAGTGSKDYDRITEILYKAYEADKESDNANQILYTLNSFEQLKAINQAIEEEKKANPVQEGH